MPPRPGNTGHYVTSFSKSTHKTPPQSNRVKRDYHVRHGVADPFDGPAEHVLDKKSEKSQIKTFTSGFGRDSQC